MNKLYKIKIVTCKSGTGFTLAEVLITLLIVGIVASIVIPALINDTQDAEYRVAYKKAFADINQAFLSARNNYELVGINNSADNVAINIKAMENYFSITKVCSNAVDQGCWVDNCIGGEHDCYASLPSENQGKSIGFIDNAGREWIHYKNYGYFIMIVDTNGAKKPNRMGRDRFSFYFYDENNKEYQSVPIKVSPYYDIISAGPNCTFGNCFYRSWLK